MTTTTTEFRLAAGRTTAWVAVAYAAFVVVVVLLIDALGWVVNPVLAGCLFVQPAFFWAAFLWKTRVTVSADGLGWTDAYHGVWCSASWAEIVAAEPTRLLGIREVRLRVADGRRACLIVDVADMHGFRRAVREAAGLDHPFTRAVGG